MWFGRSKADRFRDAKVSMWFHLLDVSRSGYLAREDFQSLADRVLGVIRGAGHSGDGVAAAFEALWDVILSRADEDGDGIIGLDEFLGYHRTLAADAVGGRLPAYAVEPVWALFSALDHDHSGGISHEEYALYLRSIGSHADARLAFERLDLNGDGVVSLEEVVQHYTDWVCTSDYESPGNLLMTGSVPASTG
jgi:Ca2+-binding EF-hand superfamily protein